jgi:ATP-binding cassette subfamily B protein
MALQPSGLIPEVWARIRRTAIYLGVFSFIINLMQLVLPLYTLQVLDRVMSSGSVETLLMLTLIMSFCILFYGFFSILRSFVLQRVSEWLDERVAPYILSESISKSSHGVESAGAQTLRDLNTCRGFVAGHGAITLFDWPWTPIYFLFIFAINATIGFVVLIGAALLLLFTFISEYAGKKPMGEASKRSIANMRFVDVAVRNADIVESMGMGRAVIDAWGEKNRDVLYYQGIAADRGTVISTCSRLVRMFIQIAVIGVGAYIALDSHVTAGGIIACSILAGRALGPFDAAISTWKGFLGARDSYERLVKAIETPIVSRGAMRMPVPTGVLRADGVYFRPAGSDRIVLKGLQFQIEPGESVGIIGPSAAGKSTLVKLIVGIWPATQGSIRLDGVDVYKWNREDFGRYVGYLPQDVELFPDTVRNNIARLDPSATDEEVVEAAMMAGTHDMILRLPKGYDTVVGEGLAGLSPGQKQRIGLARALFRRPKLLVLDEPNSNLDGDGERALTRALAIAKELGITTIMVAHKPSLVANLDKIIMLRAGALEAFGPREEILGKYVRNAPQRVEQIVEAGTSGEDVAGEPGTGPSVTRKQG